MKFYNMGKIMDNVNVYNKYLLTTIISERARQISNDHSASTAWDKHPDEKAISVALADMEAGNVVVKLNSETIPDAIESELEGEKQEEGETVEPTAPEESTSPEKPADA